MADLVISPVVIAANILQFVQDSLVSADARYMAPDKWDPNQEGTERWFQVTVPTMAQTVGRQGIGDEWKGTIRCEAFSRNQDAQMEVLKLVSDIQAALCQEHFVTLDNTDVSLPPVGLCSIYEPQVQFRGRQGPYQMAVLNANFKVTRTA